MQIFCHAFIWNHFTNHKFKIHFSFWLLINYQTFNKNIDTKVINLVIWCPRVSVTPAFPLILMKTRWTRMTQHLWGGGGGPDQCTTQRTRGGHDAGHGGQTGQMCVCCCGLRSCAHTAAFIEGSGGARWRLESSAAATENTESARTCTEEANC